MEINLFLPCDLFFFVFFAIDTDAAEERLRAKDLTEEKTRGKKTTKASECIFPLKDSQQTPY